jgi:hypothetical protein
MVASMTMSAEARHRAPRVAMVSPSRVPPPAAMMNAVHDALLAAGVKDIQMPASPHRVWKAIQSAKA